MIPFVYSLYLGSESPEVIFFFLCYRGSEALFLSYLFSSLWECKGTHTQECKGTHPRDRREPTHGTAVKGACMWSVACVCIATYSAKVATMYVVVFHLSSSDWDPRCYIRLSYHVGGLPTSTVHRQRIISTLHILESKQFFRQVII